MQHRLPQQARTASHFVNYHSSALVCNTKGSSVSQQMCDSAPRVVPSLGSCTLMPPTTFNTISTQRKPNIQSIPPKDTGSQHNIAPTPSDARTAGHLLVGTLTRRHWHRHLRSAHASCCMAARTALCPQTAAVGLHRHIPGANHPARYVDTAVRIA